ncbi:MAG: putative integral membrane protein [Planctomycetota bacterium]|jgi:uncharacterized integral membrane protein
MIIGCLTKLVFLPMKAPRKFALLALTVSAGLVVIQNAEQTDISFLFWDGEMPLVMLLMSVLVAGVAIGYLLGWKKPPRRSENEPVEKVSPNAKYQ